MLIAVAGKGGSGKTSLCALLLDELARHYYAGRILAVDADPAATLHLALGWPPPTASIATVRDRLKLEARTVRALPTGTSPTDYVLEQLGQAGVLVRGRLRQMRLDLISMGQGEGPGCYCSVNAALKTVLSGLVSQYELILVDNEAGLEWLSRYRLAQIDQLLVVTTPTLASHAVAGRIVETARQLDLSIGQVWEIENRLPGGPDPDPVPTAARKLRVQDDKDLGRLERRAWPAVRLAEASPIRQALAPIVEVCFSCV